MELNKISPRKKKGQLTLSDAPNVVLLVGLVFLIMATIALVSQEYSEALDSDGNLSTTDNVAQNVTADLNQELADNTSIAGIVLTISLVGIVLTVLIGIFVGFRARNI